MSTCTQRKPTDTGARRNGVVAALMVALLTVSPGRECDVTLGSK
jgi:hypothetical protein